MEGNSGREGKPYVRFSGQGRWLQVFEHRVELLPQLLHAPPAGLEQNSLETDRQTVPDQRQSSCNVCVIWSYLWFTAQEILLPENWLNKCPKDLDVNPGHKDLTEVHLQPAHKCSLLGQTHSLLLLHEIRLLPDISSENNHSNSVDFSLICILSNQMSHCPKTTVLISICNNGLRAVELLEYNAHLRW